MSAPANDPPERSTPRALPEDGGVFAHHGLPLGSVIGGLEITGLIGEGGFGIVYLAFDPTLQRQVALKEYMPSSLASRGANSSDVSVRSQKFLDTFNAGLRSFINEARLLAHFDHPSLIKVHQFWQANRTAYMVMPYYQGQTLKAHVRALAEKGQSPDEATLRRWLTPLLDALEVIHAQQCYHRDIAPDNILLTSNGPLLLDFGAARRVISDMTQALTVILKPGYAPIEQYGDASSMAQGPWTDLYALASVLYFCITGRTPITSVERVMGDPLPQLASVAAGRYAPGFLSAIDAALAVKPADRPQSVAEFRAMLEKSTPTLRPSTVGAPAPPAAHTTARSQTGSHDLQPTQVLPRPVQPRPVPPRPKAAPPTPPQPGAQPRRWGFAVAATSVAVLVSVALGFVLTSRRDEPHEEVLQSPPRRVAPPAMSTAPAHPSVTPLPVLEPGTPPPAKPQTTLATPVVPLFAPAPPAAPSPLPPTTLAAPATPAVAPVAPSAARPPAAAPTPAVARAPTGDVARPVASPGVRDSRPSRREQSLPRQVPAPTAETLAPTPLTPAPPAPVADSAVPVPALAPAPAASPSPAAAAQAERVTRPSRSPRCAELYQKGSQEPLSLEEATFLRSDCR